jgi:hypothetical protein
MTVGRQAELSYYYKGVSKVTGVNQGYVEGGLRNMFIDKEFGRAESAQVREMTSEKAVSSGGGGAGCACHCGGRPLDGRQSLPNYSQVNQDRECESELRRELFTEHVYR